MVRARGRSSFYSPPPDATVEVRCCDWPDCGEEGLYRAPHSRQELKRYDWFCLEHIRQVNAKWNYYEGMTEQEVEADRRRDTVWGRPSWPLGVGTDGRGPNAYRMRDGFGIFEEGGPAGRNENKPSGPLDERDRAMSILDLHPPVTKAEVKARYKQLVKLYHPDANGGDKGSEDRLKEINQAYTTIMASLTA